MTVPEIKAQIVAWIKTGIPNNVKSSNMRTLLNWITLRMDVQEVGRLKITKTSGNVSHQLQEGDKVTGIVEDTHIINAIYLGGNINLLSSYAVINDPNYGSNNPTENEYTTINALLAGQASQTAGFNQKVMDASGDPNASSGSAVYFYKGSGTGQLTDYIRLSDANTSLSNFLPKGNFEGTADDIIAQIAAANDPTVDHTYVDIPTMLAAQNEQITDDLIKVIDAGADSRITGKAYYFYNGTIAGTIDDYHLLSNSEVATLTAQAVIDALGYVPIETETDPTVPQHVKDILTTDIDSWSAKQDSIVDINNIILTQHLPSFVDDVIEGTWVNTTTFNDLNGVSLTPEDGKIYIDTTSNKSYRWSGSVYVLLTGGIVLGETASTAYRGDRGKIAYDHSLLIDGNPHNVTAAQVGLSNVDNTSDASKPVSADQLAALDGKVDDGQVLTNVPLGAVFTDNDTVYNDTAIQSEVTDNTNARHSHLNKPTLDKFGEDVDGKPTYNSVKVDTTIAQRDVYDGLNSTDNTISLSANQGKVLKDVQDTQQTAINLNTAKETNVAHPLVETAVPVGAVFTDTIYTHPTSHPATIIDQTSSYRFVTDAEKTTWNGKQEDLGFTPDKKRTRKEVSVTTQYTLIAADFTDFYLDFTADGGQTISLILNAGVMPDNGELRAISSGNNFIVPTVGTGTVIFIKPDSANLKTVPFAWFGMVKATAANTYSVNGSLESNVPTGLDLRASNLAGDLSAAEKDALKIKTGNKYGTRAVLAAAQIDWADGVDVHTKTITAALALTEINLPQGANVFIKKLIIDGNFPVTMPGAHYVWKGGVAGGVSDAYVFDCINGNAGSLRIEYTITPNA